MTTKTIKDAQPEGLFIGTWRHQQMLEMDQRFCERVAQALAQERAEAAAGADRREIGGRPSAA